MHNFWLNCALNFAPAFSDVLLNDKAIIVPNKFSTLENLKQFHLV